jgi:hypothetical protein
MEPADIVAFNIAQNVAKYASNTIPAISRQPHSINPGLSWQSARIATTPTPAELNLIDQHIAQQQKGRNVLSFLSNVALGQVPFAGPIYSGMRGVDNIMGLLNRAQPFRSTNIGDLIARALVPINRRGMVDAATRSVRGSSPVSRGGTSGAGQGWNWWEDETRFR